MDMEQRMHIAFASRLSYYLAIPLASSFNEKVPISSCMLLLCANVDTYEPIFRSLPDYKRYQVVTESAEFALSIYMKMIKS